MKITRVRIEAYKHVRGMTFFPLPTLSILIGKNNSGKTNILEAVYALAEGAAPVDGDFVVEGEHNGKPCTFSTSEQTPAITAEAQGRIAHLKEARFGPNTTGTDYFREIERLYGTLMENTERFRAFHISLKGYFPHLSVRQEGESLLFHDEEDLPIDRLGSGFHQVFAILLYLYHPGIDIVLIDEPESHLHPSLIERLRDDIARRSAEYATQVIISTHSALFVTPRLLANLFRVVRHDRTMDIFPIRRETLDADRFEQEIDPSVGQAFFADKVLLLEGVADRLLMEGLIRRFSQGTDTIKVIDVGGKDNVSVYRDLCRAFGIRYYVMLDSDALGKQVTNLVRETLIEGHMLDHSRDTQRTWLRGRRIFILPDGPLEHHYPRHYQRRERTKPLNALAAARGISPDEYTSQCSALKQVIDAFHDA